MDFFDILWLVVCVGLPVVTGIMSASEKKKKAAQKAGAPVPVQPDKLDWKDIVKSIAEEMQKADLEDDDEEDEKKVKSAPAPVPVATVPRAEAVRPVPQPVVTHRELKKEPVQVKDIDNGNEKEKIDLRKLVIYSTIMEPKFKE